MFFVRTSLLMRLLLGYKALHSLSHHTRSSLLPGCYFLVEQFFLVVFFLLQASQSFSSPIYLKTNINDIPFYFWYGFVILSINLERAAIYAGVNLPQVTVVDPTDTGLLLSFFFINFRGFCTQKRISVSSIY